MTYEPILSRRMELPIGMYMALIALAIATGFFLGHSTKKVAVSAPAPSFRVLATIPASVPKYHYDENGWLQVNPKQAEGVSGDLLVVGVMEGETGPDRIGLGWGGETVWVDSNKVGELHLARLMERADQ